MSNLSSLEKRLDCNKLEIKKLKRKNKAFFIYQISICLLFNILGIPFALMWQKRKKKNLEKINELEKNNKAIKNKIVTVRKELEKVSIMLDDTKKTINDSISKVDMNVRKIRQSELYLNLFSNIKKYDLAKELPNDFLLKIKQKQEVDYEAFMKKGTTRDQPENFVVFDLETTGLNPEYNEIIEIGAIRFVNDVPTEIFHTLVKPKKKITEKITSITGITNEMLSDAKAIDEIIPFFIDFIGENVLVAHNASFDVSFILENLYNLGYKKIKNKVIDTLALSRRSVRDYDFIEDCDKKLKNYKLVTLKDEFGLFELSSHNSIDDCKACAYVYLRIKAMQGEVCYVGDNTVEIASDIFESLLGS